MPRIRVMVAAMLAVTARPTHAQQEPKLKRTEVVVIADLSDRIHPGYHPGQIARDTAILHIISDEFGNVVKKNRYLFSRDRLRTLYVGGENPPTEPRVDIARMNEDHRV